MIDVAALLAAGDESTGDEEAEPPATTVLWRDGSTVFRLSSPGLGFGELETFIEGMRPVSIIDWVDRFSARFVTGDEQEFDEAGEPIPTTTVQPCNPQPRFGSTLIP